MTFFEGPGTLVCNTIALIAGAAFGTRKSMVEGTLACSVALSYVFSDVSCDESALTNKCPNII